jgi:hypothetical protein
MWNLWWAQLHWNEFSLGISDSSDDYFSATAPLYESFDRRMVDVRMISELMTWRG